MASSTTPLLRLGLRPCSQHKTLPMPNPKSFLSSIPLSSSIMGRSSNNRKSTLVCMSYQTVPATERLISSASYFLPLFNGLQYGRFLFVQYPALGMVLEPIFPLLNVYRSIPYASFVVFFGLYLGVVRNPKFSRYVRFNSMQAVVLDVLLALPLLFQRIFNPGRGLGLRMLVLGYNAIFLFIVLSFLYSVAHCVVGRTPFLPFVAAAADRQL